MSSFEALWLGIVQGLTEFFPVSSSGHLVLFQTLLGVEGQAGLVFEVAVHVATLIAILVFYSRRIGELVWGALRLQPAALGYAGKLALGTAPAVAVALLARDFVEAQFGSPTLVGVSLLLTGSIVWSTRSTTPKAHGAEPSWMGALLIGCAQACAILPGISRSGSTVAAALALGVSPRPAAEFSFLLGIIAIAGAAVLTIPDLGDASREELSAIAVGSVAALLSGLAAITLFVRMLQGRVFHYFAWWAWGAGLAFLGWLALQPASLS